MKRLKVLGIVAAFALGFAAAPMPDAASAQSSSAAPATIAFPGAQGWAAQTPGGRGGRIIRVTTLAGAGPGSLRAAIETAGPRIVVFEVGGVIDLGRETLKVREPFLTIAGQTAPSPGVTLIRGGMDIATHDGVIRHLRIRPGEAGAAKSSGWDEDGISTVAAYNVIVDHCSITWATDENLSASGPRFTGSTPDEWRAGTSHRITFSNNLLAEGLAHSTHSKLEHSKGSLIHDNVSDILIVGNLYAHNVERSPMFKGGVRGVIANNLIYNPGPRAIHYNLMAEEWGDKPFETGQMVVVGNVLRAGPSTPGDLAFFMLGGYGDVLLHMSDNIAVNRLGAPLPMLGRYTAAPARIVEAARPPLWPAGFVAIRAQDVQRSVLAKAGARPWDRDSHDVRVIADVAEGRGRIIDSQQEVRGYPVHPETRRPFDPALWNLDTMEPLSPATLDSGTRARGT
ncbi:MAG: pectate lyase [Alphaproteobacteria bacterium]|nr:pectate lyase [Alphaproteobacteria bacterium]